MLEIVRSTLGRLARDKTGNTLAMIAVALIPLLALTGGAIDMGRGYLAQSRLQQACDAGVLATRKRLGTSPAVGGDIPDDAAEIGGRFFNVNFRDGAYGTANSKFEMTLEGDFSVSGKASVDVPTTIIKLFSYEKLDLAVECAAQLAMPANTDIMMALDVTGSMTRINPGDTLSRLEILKLVLKDFYNKVEAGKRPGGRIRYGFVPYANNVNVGGLLKDEWVVKDWTYQSRVKVAAGDEPTTSWFYTPTTPISGTRTVTVESTYGALWGGTSNICPVMPAGNATYDYVVINKTSVPYAGPPVGTETRTTYQVKINRDEYWTKINGLTCTVYKSVNVDYVLQYDYVTRPMLAKGTWWNYQPVTRDVSNWRKETVGCIEERDTYVIDDYDNVDLSRALDLDIDRVPTPGNSATQWRPHHPTLIYARTLDMNNHGSYTKAWPITTNKEYISPYNAGFAACPLKSLKLAEISPEALDDYIKKLWPTGSTYHDVGMIWAGRLISPTGLFAAENADVSPSQPTGRHVIFMTDGQTEPLDLNYTSYGMEPIDGRRWSVTSPLSLHDTVEERFAFACKEVKKRNITVWFIAFGTRLNPVMEECGGPGHSFQADDGDELAAAFDTIANQVGELRLSR